MAKFTVLQMQFINDLRANPGREVRNGDHQIARNLACKGVVNLRASFETINEMVDGKVGAQWRGQVWRAWLVL